MDIQAIIDRAYSPDNTRAIGSIVKDEANFLCQMVNQIKPETVVEVGVASGRSSVVLGLCLAGDSYGHLHSFDFSTSYYGDRDLPVGFLANEVLSQSEQQYVTINTDSTSFDVGKNLEGMTIDMAFIDANHQHPWPTLDTIALLPFMSASSIILHHDLRLFRKPKFRHGVGPKFIYDNVSKNRIVLPTGYNVLEKISCNMFGVRYDQNYLEYAEELADSLLMPSTLGKKLGVETKEDITSFIFEFYEGTSLPEVWEYVSKKL